MKDYRSRYWTRESDIRLEMNSDRRATLNIIQARTFKTSFNSNVSFASFRFPNCFSDITEISFLSWNFNYTGSSVLFNRRKIIKLPFHFSTEYTIVTTLQTRKPSVSHCSTLHILERFPRSRVESDSTHGVLGRANRRFAWSNFQLYWFCVMWVSGHAFAGEAEQPSDARVVPREPKSAIIAH
jgi:hypothetical protein